MTADIKSVGEVVTYSKNKVIIPCTPEKILDSFGTYVQLSQINSFFVNV